MASHGDCGVPPPPSSQKNAGVVERWGDMDVYWYGQPTNGAAIVLVCDVFGFDTPQLRAIADHFAAAGFLAVVPDFVHKDPVVDFGKFAEWKAKHEPEGEVPNLMKVIEHVKTKGANKIGAVGFCWGAKVAIGGNLNGATQATVMCHPSFVTLEDIEAAKTPLAHLAPEEDNITPKEKALEFGAKLKDNKDSKVSSHSFVKVFPGVAHGFTCRYDPADAAASKIAQEAHNDALEFFKKTLL